MAENEPAVSYGEMSLEELANRRIELTAEFDRLDAEKKTKADLEKLTELGAEIVKVREAHKELSDALTAQADLVKAIHGEPEPETGEDPDNIQHADDEPVTSDSTATTPEPELVTAAAPERPKVDVRDVIKSGNRLNASLAEASKHVPQRPQDAPLRGDNELVIVASADVPGYPQGSALPDIKTLAHAMHKRARGLSVTKNAPNYAPVASLQRDYKYRLNDQSSNAEIQDVLDAALDVEQLTAAGGWCAPSTISYDFFNIVCEDGLIDLPTIGIDRGGMRFPVSPSFGSLAGQVWTWTETQDIAAATGTDQSGTKPCFRVPCPDYDEERLDCDGICLTVGNLMSDAFPELVANHLRLLMATKAHYTNVRIIQRLVAGSTAVTFTPTGHGVAAPVLEAVELQVMDYRTKFAMCDGAILEAIFPTFVMAMFRADLAKRNGVDMLDVTDAQIAAWFTMRGVRVQLVQDWQVRGAGQLGQTTPSTAWPTTIQFLLFAAGTWVRGNGLNLDLGVVRDSTLNATNDFTAAWMEECYLIAMIGHESRLVTVPVCADGTTGLQVAMGCTL